MTLWAKNVAGIKKGRNLCNDAMLTHTESHSTDNAASDVVFFKCWLLMIGSRASTWSNCHRVLAHNCDSDNDLCWSESNFEDDMNMNHWARVQTPYIGDGAPTLNMESLYSNRYVKPLLSGWWPSPTGNQWEFRPQHIGFAELANLQASEQLTNWHWEEDLRRERK